MDNNALQEIENNIPSGSGELYRYWKSNPIYLSNGESTTITLPAKPKLFTYILATALSDNAGYYFPDTNLSNIYKEDQAANVEFTLIDNILQLHVVKDVYAGYNIEVRIWY